MSIPLLILSDAATAGSGLGRIAGDLARRIAANMPDVFRVATFGYGGVVSRYLPYPQYVMEGMEPGEWVTPTLPEVWKDLAGDQEGILLCVWDLSRLGWLLRPDIQCEKGDLRNFLLSKPFKIWTYLPIDAAGPNESLTFPLRENLKGADRILAYGKWGAGVVDRTLSLPQGTTQHLPHGIDRSVFYERDRTLCRKNFVSYTKAFTLMGNLAERVKSDDVLVSIIATNQTRKNWALGIETVAMLSSQYKIRLWIKTDQLERKWSIPALLLDFGIADRTMITLDDLTDDEMAQAYSASDVVLGIAPEGFGYVHVEALSCRTPCIAGSYAGGAELVPKSMRVDPVAFYYEGMWANKRPVYKPADWYTKASHWLGPRGSVDMKYEWTNLWPEWEKWLLEGIE